MCALMGDGYSAAAATILLWQLLSPIANSVNFGLCDCRALRVGVGGVTGDSETDPFCIHSVWVIVRETSKYLLNE